jgi:hypothetical protein
MSPPLREGAGRPQPARPTASSATSGDTGFPGCPSFRRPAGARVGIRGLCGQAGALRACGRPPRGGPSWEFAQGRLLHAWRLP